MESSFDITCPHCQQTLEADLSLAGKTVDCPSCGQPFKVFASQTQPVAKSTLCSMPSEASIVVPTCKTNASRRKWLLLGGGVIVLIAGLVSVFEIHASLKQKRIRTRRREALQAIVERRKEQPNSKPAADIYRLAMQHYYGNGIMQDYGKALQLLKSASDKGNTDASAVLSEIYMSGDAGESEDWELAVSYAEKYGDDSTGERYDLVQHVLGQCFFWGYTKKDGTHVQDFKRAYNHCKNPRSHSFDKLLAGFMEYYGVGTDENKERAAETFYKTCKDMPAYEGAGHCAVCLGWMYLQGEGITRNENEAWKWLQYGVRTAFPTLVAEAKKPLSEQDRRAFESRFSQNSVTSFSPFSYKMYLLIGDEGIIRIGGVEMNLVNKGLRAYFTPYHWRKTSYNIDKL